jgi:hypothetical protein
MSGYLFHVKALQLNDGCEPKSFIYAAWLEDGTEAKQAISSRCDQKSAVKMLSGIDDRQLRAIGIRPGEVSRISTSN